ncbi:MAG: hypothetical protein ACI4XL_12205 [Bacillus sp. (in: firmicutes)]
MPKRALVLSLSVSAALLLNGCSLLETKEKAEPTAEAKTDFDSRWKESPLFTAGGYTMIGEVNKLGFIYDEDVRFIAGQKNKYMWHFWGVDDGANLTVQATHEESGERITMIEDEQLAGKNNGADVHLSSSLGLPKTGMWELNALVDANISAAFMLKSMKNRFFFKCWGRVFALPLILMNRRCFYTDGEGGFLHGIG